MTLVSIQIDLDVSRYCELLIKKVVLWKKRFCLLNRLQHILKFSLNIILKKKWT